MANAGASKTAMVGDIVSFDGSASSDPEGAMLTFAWDFGDGGTGSGAQPIHQYNKAGQYAVSLVVSDGKDINTAYVTVIVQEKSGFTLGGNTLLYVALGVVALILIVIIIVMLSRGKRPPRIYSSR
jgi:hypothetical protein